MKDVLGIFFVSLVMVNSPVFCQTPDVTGVYEAVDNKPDSIVPVYSVVRLEKNNRFIYKYGCGDIGGEMTGTWDQKGDKLKLTADKKYIGGKIMYANINLLTLTIVPTGLKPDRVIDSGWCKYGMVHLKK